MSDAALKHLHDVGCAGDVNSKIGLIRFVRHPLEIADELPGVLGVTEDDDVARFPVFRDQQPAPEWTRDCVLKILWPVRQTLDRADAIDAFHPPGQFLQSC